VPPLAARRISFALSIGIVRSAFAPVEMGPKMKKQPSVSSDDLVLQLLIIDGDRKSLAIVREALADERVEIHVTAEAAEGLDLIRKHRPHIVLLDMETPKMDCKQLLEDILGIDPGIDVILISGQYSADAAVEAIQKGASDYLAKPIAVTRLREKVEQLISNAQLRQHSQRLEGEMVDAFQFEGMIGRSPLMLELFGKINRVARHFRTILLIGETGTGKELAAKALHRLGTRATGPFIACNCSAWAGSLLETELFGCVKGAFTGATHDRKGVFEFASGGTLLLDEIGELPLPSQAKLLRVLQNQEIQRVGSPVVHNVDVRVIAATSRNLEEMVAKKKFREDLYYRLSMMEIRMPRLADRREDLPLLERHLVHQFAAQSDKQIRGLTRRAQAVLSRYSWPGNVRELENVIGHCCIMTETNIIDVQDLPERLRVPQDSWILQEGKEEVLSLQEMQRRYARQIVDRVNNKTQAADILRISRSRLYRLLAEGPFKGIGKKSQGSDRSPIQP
jgi:two-component system response regulator HydG